MSVLIKGMEMPKEGFITITVTSDGRVVGNSKKENGKFEYLDNKDIATAVPVPPHGRLVDVDALMKRMWDETDCMISVPATFVRDAPTVIPADTAEEGET